jgi:hypothetical protein
MITTYTPTYIDNDKNFQVQLAKLERRLKT